MSKFNYPNVLALRGVCLDGGPSPFIIMPYMSNGSLLSYLKKNRATLVVSAEEGVMPWMITYYDCGSGFHFGFCTCTGRCCQQAADGHVSSGGYGNGVSSKNETGTQRLGSKKLHVSRSSYTYYM